MPARGYDDDDETKMEALRAYLSNLDRILQSEIEEFGLDSYTAGLILGEFGFIRDMESEADDPDPARVAIMPVLIVRTLALPESLM